GGGVADRAPRPDDARLGRRLCAGGAGRPDPPVRRHRGRRGPGGGPGPGAGMSTGPGRGPRPGGVPTTEHHPAARGRGPAADDALVPRSVRVAAAWSWRLLLIGLALAVLVLAMAVGKVI